MIKKIFIGLSILPLIALSGTASTRLDKELSDITLVSSIDTVSEENSAPIKVEPTWKCLDCSPNEQYVLKKLQEYTKINDRNALATIMGNIKSESNFRANICEGGARVSYTECKSGGFGLIQWTSIGRYKGLGNFCARYQCDPSSLEGQVRWMVNEPIFQRVLPEFEGHGNTIPQYMSHAYYWLGWGIKGYREQYAYDYSKKMVLT